LLASTPTSSGRLAAQSLADGSATTVHVYTPDIVAGEGINVLDSENRAGREKRRPTPPEIESAIGTDGNYRTSLRAGLRVS
jgi:hypothetical protein